MKSIARITLIATMALGASAAGLRGTRQLAGAKNCHAIAGSGATDDWCQLNCPGMVKAYGKWCAWNSDGTPTTPSTPLPTPLPTPTPATKPVPAAKGAGKIAQGDVRGAWCMGYHCNEQNYLPWSDVNVVSAGAFQANIGAEPPSLATGPASGVARRNLVLGGAGVMGALPTAETLASWMAEKNYNGLEFDMEGALHGKFDEVAALAKQVKALRPNVHTPVQVTVMASGDWAAAGGSAYWKAAQDHFDTIALMTYGLRMEGAGWEIPKADPKSGATYHYIAQWLELKPNKVVLAMTTLGLEDYMVSFYDSLVTEHSLAGIAYWTPANGSPPVQADRKSVV